MRLPKSDLADQCCHDISGHKDNNQKGLRGNKRNQRMKTWCKEAYGVLYFHFCMGGIDQCIHWHIFYLLSKKAWIHPRNDKNTDWIYWKWIITCQNFVDRISGNRSISKATEGSLPSRRGGKVLKAEFSDWGSAIKWSSHWASCFLLVAMPHNRPSLATNRGNFFQSKNMFFRSKVLPPTKMLPANKMLP